MKLGKLQQYWIEQLRKHPERQTSSALGEGNPKDYKACCLGELLLCSYRIKKQKLPFEGDIIIDENDGALLSSSYKELGLKSDTGSILNGKAFVINGKKHYSLSGANDGGVSWPQIADAVETNPDWFFTKSL